MQLKLLGNLDLKQVHNAPAKALQHQRNRPIQLQEQIPGSRHFFRIFTSSLSRFDFGSLTVKRYLGRASAIPGIRAHNNRGRGRGDSFRGS